VSDLTSRGGCSPPPFGGCAGPADGRFRRRTAATLRGGWVIIDGQANQTLLRDDGFTLVEILITVLIIGILIGIAVPSYLSFSSRGTDAAAQANLRSSIPAAEAYFHDNDTYASMTVALLRASYDSSISQDVAVSGTNTAGKYCLKVDGSGTRVYYYAGPGGPIFQGTATTKPAGSTC